MEFHDDSDEQHKLPFPPVFVLYRDQSADTVKPVIDAMFRNVGAAQRYLNMYRALGEHEFLTIEELDGQSGQACIHSALTAGTMRMVLTDEGPRAVPKEMAGLWGHECDDPDCDCHEEGDNE